MRKSLFSLVTASVLLSGAGLASAQTTTTTTTQWTPDQRSSITQVLDQPALQILQRPNVQASRRHGIAFYRDNVSAAEHRSGSVA